ncbi:MAG: McrB family protein [Armatimonadota bacterium]
MYIHNKLVIEAFKRLAYPGGGKTGIERTSGLFTFLAFDELSKIRKKDLLSFDPKTQEGSQNRTDLSNFFSKLLVVRNVNDTEWFIDDLGHINKEEKYKVAKRFSSNFLTTRLKVGSARQINYPQRPAPLLVLGLIIDESTWGISKYDGWKDSLNSFLEGRETETPWTDLGIIVLREHVFSSVDTLKDTLKVGLRELFTEELSNYWASIINEESELLNIESYFSENYVSSLDSLVEQDKLPPEIPQGGSIDGKLLLALCAKPFVILTGNSGTGKSRSAIQLINAFDSLYKLDTNSSCGAFVPVGADWVDISSILGYRNPFGPRRETVEGINFTSYEITDTLRLLLRASHPDREDIPHFLVLDEMNLSHVERYFSAFLSLAEANRSLIESGRLDIVSLNNIALIADITKSKNLELEADSAKILAESGKGLSIPANLFVIGTVNVDETTYMFSPKVLDRAHVIEIKSIEPSKYLNEDQHVPKFSFNLEDAHTLIQDAVQRQSENYWEIKPPFEASRSLTYLTDDEFEQMKAGITIVLDGIHRLLYPVGFGFGFRPINEIVAYVTVCLSAIPLARDEDIVRQLSWKKSLDRAIMQKVLPKIHGNRRELGNCLDALSNFFSGRQASYQIGDAPIIELAQKELLDFDLPDSAKRTKELHKALQASGYTTFIT